MGSIADAIQANLGRRPTQLSADAGYCSDANLAALEERGIDAYIAPGRAKHASAGEGSGARIAAMREKIKAGKLGAIDTATRGKPRYIILPRHLEEWERRHQAAEPKAGPRRQRQARAGGKDWLAGID